MLFSVAILVFGYISVAAAQTQLLPVCAQSCVGNDFGGCQTLDVACICGNKPLIAGLACCVSQRCNMNDQTSVIDFANRLCRPRGVTDLPTTATCPSSTSSVPTSTAPPSSAAPTGAAPTGNATTPGTPTTPGATGTSPSPTAAAMPICPGSYAGVGLSFALAGLLAL